MKTFKNISHLNRICRTSHGGPTYQVELGGREGTYIEITSSSWAAHLCHQPPYEYVERTAAVTGFAARAAFSAGTWWARRCASGRCSAASTRPSRARAMMLDQALLPAWPKQQLPKSPNAMPLAWIEGWWFCLICLCGLDGWGSGLEFWGGERLGKKQAGCCVCDLACSWKLAEGVMMAFCSVCSDLGGRGGYSMWNL